MPQFRPDRRRFLQLTAGLSAAASWPAVLAETGPAMLSRPIPGTDERLPAVGLGTSHEFNHVPAGGLEPLRQVLAALVEAGGRMVDTAPSLR